LFHGVHVAASPVCADDPIRYEIVVKCALRAIKADTLGLPVSNHSADSIDGASPSAQDGNDLDTVRRSHQATYAALGVDPGRNECVNLGHYLNGLWKPAQHGLMKYAQRQCVITRQRCVLTPGERRSRIRQGVGKAEDFYFSKFAEVAALEQFPHDL